VNTTVAQETPVKTSMSVPFQQMIVMQMQPVPTHREASRVRVTITTKEAVQPVPTVTHQQAVAQTVIHVLADRYVKPTPTAQHSVLNVLMMAIVTAGMSVFQKVA